MGRLLTSPLARVVGLSRRGMGTRYGVPVGTMASIAYGVPVCQPLFQTFFKKFSRVPGKAVIARDSGIIDRPLYLTP